MKMDNDHKIQILEVLRESLKKFHQRKVLKCEEPWSGTVLIVTFELKFQKVEQQGWDDPERGMLNKGKHELRSSAADRQWRFSAQTAETEGRVVGRDP